MSEAKRDVLEGRRWVLACPRCGQLQATFTKHDLWCMRCFGDTGQKVMRHVYRRDPTHNNPALRSGWPATGAEIVR